MQTYDKYVSVKQQLNEGEEIIGIYGWINNFCFDNMGFIVWTPPRYNTEYVL